MGSYNVSFGEGVDFDEAATVPMVSLKASIGLFGMLRATRSAVSERAGEDAAAHIWGGDCGWGVCYQDCQDGGDSSDYWGGGEVIPIA